jgi:hypothetical protein
MGVAELALNVTVTVSPLLNAVVLAASQILSAAWALTTNTDEKISIRARRKTEIGFMRICQG